MRKLTICAALVLATAITGCTRSSNALRVDTRAQPLPSTPSGNLQAGQLPPAGQQGYPQQTYSQQGYPQTNQQQAIYGQTAGQQPQAPTVLVPQTQTASLNDAAALAASAKPITHELMAGSWNASSDNPQCRVILSFTKWSGGYRAATRRCNAPELGSVTAWDIKNNQVVLVDSSGTQVASLASAGEEQYAGRLSSGNPVTFTR